MEAMESEGKSVAEAVDSALKKLGLRRDQVEVQILQEASSGFIGIGAKPARVRITEKRWGDSPLPPAPAPAPKPARAAEPSHRRPSAPAPAPRNSAPRPETRPPQTTPAKAQVNGGPSAVPVKNGGTHQSSPAAEKPIDQQAAIKESDALLKELMGLMKFQDAGPAVSWDGVQERVKAVIGGPDAERLTAEGGRALEALQFLATLVVSRKVGASVAVQVDAHGYWEKKEREILSIAERGVEEVKSTGKPIRLAPMDATMRRLVHRNLAGNPYVETSSEGEGTWRKIVLRPKQR